MRKRGNNEGSVYFDKDHGGRWVGAVTLDAEGGTRKRRKYYAATRKEAADKLTEALRDQNRNLPLPGAALTVGAYLDDWLAHTIRPGRRSGTYANYESAVRVHIRPLLGKVALVRLGPPHVQKLQTALLACGLGTSRIKLVRATLSAACAQAVKWNLLARNPVPLVDPPVEDEREPKLFTPEEASRLLEAARGHEFEPLYTLMLATGLRISEALGLAWSAVDTDRRVLHVRQQMTIQAGQPWRLSAPKSKSGRRSVPLIPAAVAALEAQHLRVSAYRREAYGPWPMHNLVFCDELGQPIVGRRVNRAFKDHLRAAGLPTDRTPHSLRHACGTWLTAQRVPDRVVMAILGHSSPSMTARYQHVMASMLGDAADQLAAIFPVREQSG